ncbi:MAG: hypothetical protein FJZ01_08770 [Candidatus Sericytochromatia bacterium]|nr:hypothetical protein [Candidatus Tanganyikabacteria bacterium]
MPALLSRLHRLVVLGLLALAAVAGCEAAPRFLGSFEANRAIARGAVGGAQALVSPDRLLPRDYGFLTLTLLWPTGPGQDLRGYRAQVVPDSTSKINVSVLAYGTTVATGSVTRNAGENSATLTLAVPARSNYGVVAEAVTGVSGPIARATAAGVNVLRGKTTPATMIMFSLYTPAITSFDYNAGAVGDSITLSGSRFRPSWSATPSVRLEGTAGASVSAAVTAATDTEITFTVPANTAVGRVEVLSDGVPSLSNAVFWRPSALALSATKASWDTTAAGNRAILFRSQLAFTAAPTWGLAPGRQASDYGTPPEPTFASSNSYAGTFGASSAMAATFTAKNTVASSNLTAAYGGLVSNTLTESSQPCGPFANVAVTLASPRIAAAAIVTGGRLIVAGGFSSGFPGTNGRNDVERFGIDASGNLTSLGAYGATSQLGTGRSIHAAFLAGTTAYVLGGKGAAGDLTSIEMAPIDASGDTGAWTPAGSLPVANGFARVVVVGKYAHLVSATRYQAAEIVDATGSLAGFTDVAALPRTMIRFPVVAAGSQVVAVGPHQGGGTDASNQIYAAPVVDADGNLGSLALVGGSTLATARLAHEAAVANDSVIALGGVGPGNGSAIAAFDSVEAAPILADGTLGTFATVGGVTLATRVVLPAVARVGPWLYVLGGSQTPGTNAKNTIQRAWIGPQGSNGTLAVGVQ